MTAKIDQISMLLAEDDVIDVLAFKREIEHKQLPYNYTVAHSLADADKLTEAMVFDIAVLDYNLGDGTSDVLLSGLVNKGIPVIITTGSGDEETAAMLVRKGAYDYLIKDPNRNYLKVLPATVEKAIEHKRTLQQTQLLLHAVHHASDGIFIIDRSAKLLFMNESFCSLNKSRVCVSGFNLAEIGQPVLVKETLDFITMSDFVTTKQTEMELIQSNGLTLYVSCSFNLASNPFEQGKIVIVVIRDITYRRDMELALLDANRQLEILSNVDGLTQIANRRYFDMRLRSEWYCMLREKHPLSLILLDVDMFKRYNDFYGHLVGDDCLIKIAQALNQVICRAGDIVARYGGEEFVIIIPNTDLDGVIVVAEKIQQAIRTLSIPHADSDIKEIVTISLGIATTVPEVRLNSAMLVAHADRQLYKAKHQGRDRYLASQLSYKDISNSSE